MSTLADWHIDWQTLEHIAHLHYHILDIDRHRHIVDVLFKFAAGQQIILHRHVAHNTMFVLQGEHRIYAADGCVREVRPTGRYTSSPPSPTPHREGGGDEDAIVLFSIRDPGPVFYEILDDDSKLIATLGWQAFEDLYSLQINRQTQRAALVE
jgi:quercetin dioxygenase-like cupin family protein